MKNSTYRFNTDNDFSELRFITRLLLLLAILTGFLFLRVFATNTFSADIVADQKVTAVLAFVFLIGAILGLAASWRWQGAGGLISVLCGLGLAIVTALTVTENIWLTALFYSSPFLIAGGLSLISWRTTQSGIR